MTTATKRTKPTTATIPERLREYAAEMNAQALARWRGWCQVIADGGDAPAVGDLLEVAQSLKIDNPPAELQADADAVAELAKIDRAAAQCRQVVADALKPYGTVAALERKIEAAKAEAARLTADLDMITGGGSESYWTWAAHQVRKKATRLFPEYKIVRDEPEYFAIPEEVDE
jgi:hypothetical protein